MTSQARREARAEFATRLFVLVLVVLLVGAVVTIVQIRSTQVDNTAKNDQQTQILKTIKKLAKRVESCTTPGEPCQKRGQRQTAQVVSVLLSGNVNALACAMQVPQGTSVDRTIALITTCLHDLPGQP